MPTLLRLNVLHYGENRCSLFSILFSRQVNLKSKNNSSVLNFLTDNDQMLGKSLVKSSRGHFFEWPYSTIVLLGYEII